MLKWWSRGGANIASNYLLFKGFLIVFAVMPPKVPPPFIFDERRFWELNWRP